MLPRAGRERHRVLAGGSGGVGPPWIRHPRAPRSPQLSRASSPPWAGQCRPSPGRPPAPRASCPSAAASPASGSPCRHRPCRDGFSTPPSWARPAPAGSPSPPGSASSGAAAPAPGGPGGPCWVCPPQPCPWLVPPSGCSALPDRHGPPEPSLPSSPASSPGSSSPPLQLVTPRGHPRALRPRPPVPSGQTTS